MLVDQMSANTINDGQLATGLHRETADATDSDGSIRVLQSVYKDAETR